MKIRVAIYDDSIQRRDSIAMLLDSDDRFEFIGDYPDCSNIIANTASHGPDVILLDIDMPVVDGIEGLKKLRSQFPKTKVLMQTVFDDNEKIFEAICEGANGYILKQESPEELLRGITEVHEGGAPMTPSIATKVLSLVGRNSRPSIKDSFSLTSREKEILELLVKGYSYKMIAEECSITFATVNTHITKIYNKLQVHSVAAAVTKAIREGLV